MLMISVPFFVYLEWGERYLTGENLKIVWAEFSTLSWAVLLKSDISVLPKNSHF